MAYPFGTLSLRPLVGYGFGDRVGGQGHIIRGGVQGQCAPGNIEQQDMHWHWAYVCSGELPAHLQRTACISALSPFTPHAGKIYNDKTGAVVDDFYHR